MYHAGNHGKTVRDCVFESRADFGASTGREILLLQCTSKNKDLAENPRGTPLNMFQVTAVPTAGQNSAQSP